MMKNKQEAIKSLRLWKTIYLTTFFLPIVILGAYFAYSITYVPKPQNILLNNFDAVYTSEDLSNTDITEGQLKQLVFKTLEYTFDFNYLSLSNDSVYKKYLSGEMSTDLPDHRDSIRSLYAVEFFPDLLTILTSGPWMERLYSERRKIKVLFSTPPVRNNIASNWVLSTDNRLNAEYSGFFHVISSSENFKTFRFKVEYTVVMERKPDVVNVNMPDYFFTPLVKPNTNEWRVKSLEVSVGSKS